VTQDIIAPQGMGMQLNAYSPSSADCVYQQYITSFNAKSPKLQINWQLESWPSTSYRNYLHKTFNQRKGNIFNEHGAYLGPFPTPSYRIPAGYKIIYKLLYDPNDPSSAIIGANYTVGNERVRKSSGPQFIRNYKIWSTNALVPRSAMAPILALQLNLVGVTNGEYMTISSGGGTITYEAAAPLTAEGTQPTTVAAKGVFTQEASNIVYAAVPARPNRKIVQTFGVPQSFTGTGPASGISCPKGLTYNSLTKTCQIGGRIITNDKAPPVPLPR
jgi:hypothetical protein